MVNNGIVKIGGLFCGRLLAPYASLAFPIIKISSIKIPKHKKPQTKKHTHKKSYILYITTIKQCYHIIIYNSIVKTMILSYIYNYNTIILYYNKAIKQYNTIIIPARACIRIYYNMSERLPAIYKQSIILCNYTIFYAFCLESVYKLFRKNTLNKPAASGTM